MLTSGSMPVEYVYVVCDRHTGLHSRLGWAQVITRTDGRALGVIAHLYVDPRALAVVSLSLRAKGLGGGAAGNMPLAALCQARPYQGAEGSVFAVSSLACAGWQNEGRRTTSGAPAQPMPLCPAWPVPIGRRRAAHYQRRACKANAPVSSPACADWQKEGGALPAARLHSQCRAPGRSTWQYDGLQAARRGFLTAAHGTLWRADRGRRARARRARRDGRAAG